MQKALALMMTGDKVSAEEAEKLNMIYKFYDNIFLYHFTNLKKEDSNPEIVAIGSISFCQSSHLVFIYIYINILFIRF